jgi:phosphosulfolactate phosphohydrolase-like enzyme
MDYTKKHIDVVDSKEIFETNLKNGVYSAPWVVYIKNNDKYDVVYSNDQNRVVLEDLNFAELLNRRIEILENEKVYCTENEYDELIANPTMDITIHNIKNGIIVEEIHRFDTTKLYCVYEEEEPV